MSCWCGRRRTCVFFFFFGFCDVMAGLADDITPAGLARCFDLVRPICIFFSWVRL